MNRGQNQVIAEKVSSTVRVLELLGLDYEVLPPRSERRKGNRSPRVVHVEVGKPHGVRVYNSADGNTWANEPDGTPIKEVSSIEDLSTYLTRTYPSIISRASRKLRARRG